MMFIAYEVPIMFTLWKAIRYYTKDTEVQMLIVALFCFMQYFFSLMVFAKVLVWHLFFGDIDFAREKAIKIE